MATKKSRSTAVAVQKPLPLAKVGKDALADAVGSGVDLAKVSGAGGEFVSQDGVVRITGRGYATSGDVVPEAEIFYSKREMPRAHGPWLGEADKVAWVDEASGLECIMMREHPEGFLRGFVGVPSTHPLFGWDHDAVPASLGIEVHGGLTYSCICDDGPNPKRRLIKELRRICHVVVGEVPLQHATDHRAAGGQWWFGFDCNHVYDVVPGELRDRQSSGGGGIEARYRDDGYVVREIRNLAAQLAAIRDGRPVPARDGPPLPPIGLEPRAV